MKVVDAKMRTAVMIEACREITNAVVAWSQTTREPPSPKLLEAFDGNEGLARTAEVRAFVIIVTELFRDVEVVLGAHNNATLNLPERRALEACRRFLHNCPLIDPEQDCRGLCTPAAELVELVSNCLKDLRSSTDEALRKSLKRRGGMRFLAQSA